jgi:glucosamine kinase
MDRLLFIGVDGGGTRCRARLADEAGTTLGEGLGGPANVRRDARLALHSVLAASRAALAAAGLDVNVIGRVHAGLGLAGAGQRSALERFAGLPHPFASVSIETDAYVAWLGAFGGADGAILIAGTGSCGLAILRGKRTHVGGLGSEVSDEGSGAAIGREAIRRALWADDGRAPMTPLAAALLARFGARHDAIVDWARQATPEDYARLAPLVFEHARAGDPLGAALVREAAAELARIGARLLAAGAPRVALMGGLAEPLRPWLPEALAARLVAPEGDALDGALLMARRALADRDHSARKRA